MIAIFYILLIVLLHMVPLGGGSVVNRIAVGGLRADYILHALVFLPWMGLGPYRAAGLRATDGDRMPRRTALAWAGLGAALALGVEGLQYPLPYRSFNPLDAAFNLSGLLAGLAVWGLSRRTRHATSTMRGGKKGLQ